MRKRSLLKNFAVFSGLIAILMGVSLVAAAQSEVEPEMGMNEQYQVQLMVEGETVQAGQPFRLMLDILEMDGETPVTEFDEAHTKLLHLILVSEDLTEFLHVHPEYEGDGRFVLEGAEVPIAANYAVFADFTPTGQEQQVVRLNLTTAEAVAGTPELVAGEKEFTTAPLKFELIAPESLDAGGESAIAFHVTDVETGLDVLDLDEYLGAAGHLVIVDESGQIYLHTHPADHEGDHAMEGMEGMAASYGPHIEFVTEFPDTGHYAMWLQVQHQGEIYTVPFNVEVTGQAEGTPEAAAPSEHKGSS